MVPSCLMLLEYPFNIIPWDWRMLPFNLAVMVLYLVDTILFQWIQDSPVYNAMDWFIEPWVALGVYAATCVAMVLIFACMH